MMKRIIGLLVSILCLVLHVDGSGRLRSNSVPAPRGKPLEMAEDSGVLSETGDGGVGFLMHKESLLNSTALEALRKNDPVDKKTKERSLSPDQYGLYKATQSLEAQGLTNKQLKNVLANAPYLKAAARKAQLAYDAGELDQVVNKMSPFNPARYVLGGVVNPWQKFYGRHEVAINATTKLLVIGSALAFMFNKFGGSEYVRNKIREIFDKPPIYTVRRRKAGFFGSKPADIIKEDDLILAPSTRKQVNELIFLIRRRYEMGKTSKRKFTFPHVLLYGPPGTGKTTIAQMIADNTIGDDGNPMNFITLMASDFMQIKQEGDRLAVLKEMFTKAKNLGNTIIFLDEVDSMVQQRGKDNESPNRAFLDMLLLYMTKLSSRYMVIAATNHANKIDDALMSRFRRKIFVNLPTARNRKAILELYIENLLISKGYTSQLDTTAIANLMQGCSGRDLESFVTRLRDRIDFEQGNVATPALAEVILREMGKISGGSDEDVSLLDLEDELASDATTK